MCVLRGPLEHQWRTHAIALPIRRTYLLCSCLQTLRRKQLELRCRCRRQRCLREYWQAPLLLSLEHCTSGGGGLLRSCVDHEHSDSIGLAPSSCLASKARG